MDLLLMRLDRALALTDKHTRLYVPLLIRTFVPALLRLYRE